MSDCLKLTVYHGERDRADGGFAADALTEIFARHELQASLLLRGIEGFGAKHHLHTDRLLSLSEDLPLVSIAVDARERVTAVLAEVERLRLEGIVTLERARLLTGRLDPGELPASAKLTVYLSRHERPGHRAVVDVLRRHGVAGATVLLGVDGTAHGVRERARFFSRNADVPLMVVAVGAGDAIAAALADLAPVLARPLATVERVQVCKRDGALLAPPASAPAGTQQKLMVYAGEQARVHHALVRELRRAGAAGATSVRGIWGYHGDHAPHGDALLQLRRRVPVVTIVVDTPENCARWFTIADRLTAQAGLVTAETVPTVIRRR